MRISAVNSTSTWHDNGEQNFDVHVKHISWSETEAIGTQKIHVNSEFETNSIAIFIINQKWTTFTLKGSCNMDQVPISHRRSHL